MFPHIIVFRICPAVKEFILPISANLTSNHPSQSSQAKNPNYHTQPSPEPSTANGYMQRDEVRVLTEKNTRMVEEQRLLEERLQRLEQELSQSQASSNMRFSAGTVEEPLRGVTVYRGADKGK